MFSTSHHQIIHHQTKKEIEDSLDHVPYLDVKNITNIIADYIKDEWYIDRFIMYNDITIDKEDSSRILKIKDGWFVPTNSTEWLDVTIPDCKVNATIPSGSVCVIKPRNLLLQPYPDNQTNVFISNRYEQSDLCFGYQSMLRDENDQIIEFCIKNQHNIQIGPKSKNGLLSFLSNEENYILFRALYKNKESGDYCPCPNCASQRKKTDLIKSEVHNCMCLGNLIRSEKWTFHFDKPLRLWQQTLKYFGEDPAFYIPNSFLCRSIDTIRINQEIYKVNGWQIEEKIVD